MVCNTVQALPKCKGTDPNKWHNCSGTEESQNVKYEGEYQNGNFNGQGIATLPDGSKYVGEFKDGKFHGQGTFTLSDGTVYKGIWKKGELIERQD